MDVHLGVKSSCQVERKKCIRSFYQFSSWLSPFRQRVSNFYIQNFSTFLMMMLSLLSFVFGSFSMMVSFESVLKSWSFCAKCRCAGIALTSEYLYHGCLFLDLTVSALLTYYNVLFVHSTNYIVYLLLQFTLW